MNVFVDDQRVSLTKALKKKFAETCRRKAEIITRRLSRNGELSDRIIKEIAEGRDQKIIALLKEVETASTRRGECGEVIIERKHEMLMTLKL